MKKRYTRDQVIDLMVNARTRLEGYMARWLSVPQIKQAIQRPEDASPGDKVWDNNALVDMHAEEEKAMWNLIDKSGHQLNPGDYVTTVSGELMVLRDWSPPSTSDHGHVILHDIHGRIHEYCASSIEATCVRRHQ